MIRFYNGRLLEGETITGNELWTDGNKISYVGPTPEELPAFDRAIDLRGDLLMPGFKNAHTHSAMTFLRSAADDMSLTEWHYQQVFPREAKLTEDSTAAFVKLAFLEYLRNGITACCDMYVHTDAIARVSKQWGFRTVICGGLSANNDFDDLYREKEKYDIPGSLVSYLPGIHAEYTASDEMLKFVSDFSHKFKTPIFSHNSETYAETRVCVKNRGITPTRLMEDMGLYDYGGGGFHCVWFNEEDMDIFQRHGCWVVTNPCSNAKLASGTMPLSQMLDKNLNLAIGTDGAASNNALDMFREMYLANVLAKLKERNAAAGAPAKILRAAVSDGARCIGLTDCDCLAPGKQADIIRIDLSAPNMQPEHNIVKNLVYSGNPSNVTMTMIAGKILYENGQYFVPESLSSIYKAARKYTDEIFAD